MTIRQAVWEESETVLAFYRDTVDRTEGRADTFCWVYGLHPSDDLLAAYIKAGSLFLAEEDGKILGAGVLCKYQDPTYRGYDWSLPLKDDGVATVHLLCVSPDTTRQGVGRSLLMAFERVAEAWGKGAVRLDCLRRNKPARRFYESLGYRRAGMAWWFLCPLGWTDVILYEKNLPVREEA